MTNLNHMLTGGAGISLVEIANQIQPTGDSQTIDIVKLIIQLAIGVATLVKLFKKKTPPSI